jgi:hypothetical protein
MAPRFDLISYSWGSLDTFEMPGASPSCKP